MWCKYVDLDFVSPIDEEEFFYFWKCDVSISRYLLYFCSITTTHAEKFTHLKKKYIIVPTYYTFLFNTEVLYLPPSIKFNFCSGSLYETLLQKQLSIKILHNNYWLLKFIPISVLYGSNFVLIYYITVITVISPETKN